MVKYDENIFLIIKKYISNLINRWVKDTTKYRTYFDVIRIRPPVLANSPYYSCSM